MNEELKIIIKAVTDEAKKNLAKVKEELEDIGEESKKSSKSIDAAMKSAGKGVAIAVGAIAALTTAMVTLTKSSMEFQKSYNRLITAFQASGSTVKQATKTYTELFRFLGEADTATEASNLLVKLTNDEKELTEWTNILKGVYATFPDSLPVEALAESANETARVGKVTGNLADALNWAGVSEDAMNERLATANSLAEREAILRSTLNSLYGNSAAIYEQNNQAMLAYNESQSKVDIALANATKYIIPLMTQLNNLAATLIQVLAPAFKYVAATVMVFVDWISTILNYIKAFFGLFGGAADEAKSSADSVSKSVSKATSSSSGLGTALGNAAKQAKELKKQTMGFDELNIVSSGTSAGASGGDTGGTSGGGGGAVSAPALEMPSLDNFKIELEEAKEKVKAILALAGSVGAAILLWKLGDFVKDITSSGKALDLFKAKAKSISGIILIIAGAILLVKGYCDAWVNGISWGNFATVLGGIALIVGGLALTFGTTGAAVGLLAGGIALIVLGVKDFVTNGYSMQNVLTILAGVIAVVVGAVLLFNASLLANPITWIVIAIAALVAAFVILWNECEGFRNFWIALWEKVKVLFAAFVESIKPLINAIVEAFKMAWELIKVIWNDYLVPLFKAAWEAIKVVWNAVKPYFEMIWNNIKIIFSVVKKVLTAFFKAAWDAIKIVWNQVVSYFTAIWDTIKGIFAVVKNVLSGNWKEAWNAIKGIVATWGNYFKNTWENIKKIFGVVGTYFKSIFSAAWNGIKAIFANVGSFFSGVWTKIKNCFAAVGKWFGNIFKGAWNAVKSAFSSVSSFFSGVFTKIKNVFKNAGKVIAGAVSGTVSKAINTVLSTAVKIINGFISAINFAIKLINKIPGVEISKLDKLEVPKLATGGIVSSETLARIGEGGKKEAVLPLEQNTGWMDILADRIASKNSAPSKIVLMLDGKELGYAAINSINGITKQTGALQIALG